MERLFRVFVHTEGDESIHEVIVTAENRNHAEERARSHVKASNPGKGRNAAAAQKVTKILAVRATTKHHCLEIGVIPMAAVRELMRHTEK